jgi:hypothetical protein
MDEFLDTYDLSKLNHLWFFSHLNISITQNEIEAAIVFQKRKVQDLTGSLLNSSRPLKKK